MLLSGDIASLAGMDRINAKIFPLPERRAVLGTPEGKIKRFVDPEKDVLTPAIAEINQSPA